MVIFYDTEQHISHRSESAIFPSDSMFLLFWPTGWWFEHMSTNRKIMKVNLDLHLQEDGKRCMDEYLKGFWIT